MLGRTLFLVSKGFYKNLTDIFPQNNFFSEPQIYMAMSYKATGEVRETFVIFQ